MSRPAGFQLFRPVLRRFCSPTASLFRTPRTRPTQQQPSSATAHSKQLPKQSLHERNLQLNNYGARSEIRTVGRRHRPHHSYVLFYFRALPLRFPIERLHFLLQPLGDVTVSASFLRILPDFFFVNCIVSCARFSILALASASAL